MLSCAKNYHAGGREFRGRFSPLDIIPAHTTDIVRQHSSRYIHKQSSCGKCTQW